jgi:hypothetical protein
VSMMIRIHPCYASANRNCAQLVEYQRKTLAYFKGWSKIDTLKINDLRLTYRWDVLAFFIHQKRDRKYSENIFSQPVFFDDRGISATLGGGINADMSTTVRVLWSV